MRKIIWMAVLSASVLAGCASTPPSGSSAPAAAQAPQQQAVAVPAAAARKVVLHMTGPKEVVESSSWSGFREEWRATFADHAREAGIAFALQDGPEARPTGEPGTLLAVHVNDFRQVGIGARILLGVMTGNAYIDAKVNFRDLRNGADFGAQNYNTSSSAWDGVFARMTPQQVDAIGTGIFQQFKTAR
jgi:hypothetical protein